MYSLLRSMNVFFVSVDECIVLFRSMNVFVLLRWFRSMNVFLVSEMQANKQTTPMQTKQTIIWNETNINEKLIKSKLSIKTTESKLNLLFVYCLYRCFLLLYSYTSYIAVFCNIIILFISICWYRILLISFFVVCSMIFVYCFYPFLLYFYKFRMLFTSLFYFVSKNMLSGIYCLFRFVVFFI